MTFVKKVQAQIQVTAYSKKDYQVVLDILHKIDGLIDQLRKEDKVYGDMWQNFTDSSKDKITDELIVLVVKDMKKAD